ncbi:hypothetical protein CASFOL_027059 [Castilleja foliolosa]|uniref:VQ domain-containing protein n=1 Tax=Castilleja foliolosa TaxID=1961234 RepID=A0ABD3CML4_9LAMI
MASYENLITEQTWQFRPAFPDAWFSDELSEEIERQTRSFSSDSSHGDVFSAEIGESLFSTPAQTPTVSGGLESEIVVSRKRRGGVPTTGRVAKLRKPSKSKRLAMTTFIVADPENFRQMVQRATGVRFGGLDEQSPELEPGRINGVNWDGGLLPTLDTSDFYVDGSSSYKAAPPATERIFDSVCSFPTLESWSM